MSKSELSSLGQGIIWRQEMGEQRIANGTLNDPLFKGK